MRTNFRLYRPGHREEIDEPPLTADGHPALWEWGGWPALKTGHAVIIAGPDGQPKVPAEVPDNPDPNWHHALIPVAIGDRVVHATRWTAIGDEVMVWQVTRVEAELVGLTLTHYYFGGEWDPAEPDGLLAEAVRAALAKAWCKNCREPHWIARR